MNVALGLFAMGAVSGLYLAVAHFRGLELKMGPALAHGAGLEEGYNGKHGSAPR